MKQATHKSSGSLKVKTEPASSSQKKKAEPASSSKSAEPKSSLKKKAEPKSSSKRVARVSFKVPLSESETEADQAVSKKFADLKRKFGGRSKPTECLGREIEF